MSIFKVNFPNNPAIGIAGFTGGTFRVSLVGSMVAKGLDQRLLLRFHTEPLGIRTGYSSMLKGHGFYDGGNIPDYTEAQFDPPAGSSTDNGIYLGRNGWVLDGDFAVHLTVTARVPLDPSSAQTAANDTTLLVTGQSFFMLTGGKMLVHTIGGQLTGLPNLSRDKTINALTFDSGSGNGTWGNCTIQYA